MPRLVLADEGRLRQVLINLIGNAIKFSGGLDRPGRVSVRAVLADRQQDETASVTVDFTVIDNGIGIDDAELERLFKPFAQADASTTRRYGGTGLGLSISEMLVRLMGGSLQVQSAAGVGSTFTFRLNLAVASPQPQEAFSTAPVHGLDCLIVGADQVMAQDIAALLRPAGMAVDLALDLDTARPKAGTRAPSLWLVLPDAAGLIEHWDSSPGTRLYPQASIVSLGWGRRRVPRVVAPGRVVVDADSLTRAVLLRAVALALGKLEPQSEPPARPQPSHQPAQTREEARAGGRLILVAEDNLTNRLVILKQLALIGFTADVAVDGLEAMEMWRSGGYALVLTDLHMPKMDGYELARAIRAEESAGRRVPIIALTANALRDEESRCIACGMDAYLSKPVLLSQLRSEIERHMQPAPGQPEQIVDLAVLVALVGEDPLDLAEVLQSFTQTAKALEAGIGAAVAALDRAAVAESAHQLKGAALSIGARQLGARCDALEQAVQSCGAAELSVLHSSLAKDLAAVLEVVARMPSSGRGRPCAT